MCPNLNLNFVPRSNVPTLRICMITLTRTVVKRSGRFSSPIPLQSCVEDFHSPLQSCFEDYKCYCPVLRTVIFHYCPVSPPSCADQSTTTLRICFKWRYELLTCLLGIIVYYAPKGEKLFLTSARLYHEAKPRDIIARG